MGGKGSGRRARSIEADRREILAKAWRIIGEVLLNQTHPEYIKIAQALVVKDVTSKVDMKGEGAKEIQIVLVSPKASVTPNETSSRIPNIDDTTKANDTNEIQDS